MGNASQPRWQRSQESFSPASSCHCAIICGSCGAHDFTMSPLHSWKAFRNQMMGRQFFFSSNVISCTEAQPSHWSHFYEISITSWVAFCLTAACRSLLGDLMNSFSFSHSFSYMFYCSITGLTSSLTGLIYPICDTSQQIRMTDAGGMQIGVTLHDGSSLTSAGEGWNPADQTSILSRIRTNPSPMEQANLLPLLVIFQFNRNC